MDQRFLIYAHLRVARFNVTGRIPQIVGKIQRKTLEFAIFLVERDRSTLR
jgi:hypothetical protein